MIDFRHERVNISSEIWRLSLNTFEAYLGPHQTSMAEFLCENN